MAKRVNKKQEEDKNLSTLEKEFANVDKRIGNQFWKLRSKHGRDKIFATPQIMLEACYEYFDYQSKQVWNKTDFKGKDVEKVKIPTASPFTLTGLCIFLGVNTKYFTEFESNLDLKNKVDKDFSEVITHVREIITTQQMEGAMVGTYNANIVARKLGLSDKKETTHKGELNITGSSFEFVTPNED